MDAEHKAEIESEELEDKKQDRFRDWCGNHKQELLESFAEKHPDEWYDFLWESYNFEVTQ